MLIYDDDALGFIAESIGCSMDEADKYRRAFKKSNSKLINEFYARLTTAKKEELRTLQLNELNKYSFCKGHSLAYGQMVWALAYHKVYNNKKFWEATVKHCNSSYRKWVHYREAVNSGLKIIPGKNPFRKFQKNMRIFRFFAIFRNFFSIQYYHLPRCTEKIGG